MGRSPEADFHHGQNLLPVSGHTFTGMPFACLILVRPSGAVRGSSNRKDRR
jgi:hypothetical protein